MLDVVVLCRTGERRYELTGPVPEFYRRLFAEDDGEPSVEPWKKSAMLDFFLHDAELFFTRNKEGSLSSGIWQEDEVQTGRQALMATAMCLEDRQVLVLRLLSDEFIDRSRILQKAREHLLERRMLHNDVETYKQKASFDDLTTLRNRASFMDLLREEMKHADGHGSELALLMIDIDNFKTINDVYGHLAGDTVLSTLGRLLRDFVRREDVACRYGGEEFAVLAPFTRQHQIIRMAEKLRAHVENSDFGDLPAVTVSVGCTTYRLGESVDNFINRADLALYDAKHGGKNTVRMR